MKNGLSLLVMMLVMVSCQGLEPEIEVLNPETGSQEVKVQGVQMSVPEITYEEIAQMRVVMAADETSGLSFTWSDGDATGVYSTTDGFARFNLVTGDGLSNATFDGGGFSLTDGSTYYAFYPYEMSASDKTAIPLTFSGQSVTADNDMTSPMTKDYMWASAVSDEGNAAFSFSHIGAFLRMKISLPEGTNIDKVELMPMYDEVPQTMTFDITNQTPTASTSSPVLSITTTGVTVPAGDVATVWAVMPPKSFATDNFAVQVTSGTNVYSARIAGKAFNAGKAYKWSLVPVDVTSNPGYGFSTVTETGFANVTTSVGAGDYSGIAYISGTQYAVVDDKQNGGGIVLYDITINDDGTVGAVSKSVPTGTGSSAVTDMDNEGIAYNAASGKLYVSAEADQSIREYDTDGTATGNSFTIPEDMAVSKITSNKGFEALTYNATTERFWTTTESELTKDAAKPGLLRLQSFGTDMKPAERYLYQMDAPVKNSEEAAAAISYVFGVPALAALDDGRIIVLEREVFVASGSVEEKAANSFTTMKLYVVKPSVDGSGILRKTLLTSFSTYPLSLNFANYEGMCVGPTLSDGSKTLVLIPDSQSGSGGLTQEYVKVITFK